MRAVRLDLHNIASKELRPIPYKHDSTIHIMLYSMTPNMSQGEIALRESANKRPKVSMNSSLVCVPRIQLSEEEWAIIGDFRVRSNTQSLLLLDP